MEIFTPLLVASFGFLHAGSSAWRALRAKGQHRAMLRIAQIVAVRLSLSVQSHRGGLLVFGELGGRSVELTLYPHHVRARTRFVERLLPKAALIRSARGQVAARGLGAVPVWLDHTLRSRDASVTLQGEELRVVQRGRLSVERCHQVTEQLLDLAVAIERARPEANLR